MSEITHPALLQAENERLRALLREVRLHNSSGLTKDIQRRIDAALFQQAEPTDTFTAVDMATAAAQGFRDGQAAVEQAAAQDEREAFEQHYHRFDLSRDPVSGAYFDSEVRCLWDAWQARATRPAQTEQQPVAIASRGEHAFWVRWTDEGKSLRGPGIKLYAAPVAHTELVEALEHVKRELGVDWLHPMFDKARAALAAQGVKQ